jgi:hypothetical protein
MSDRPNEHIVSYMKQFLCKEPSFALMISGDWGTGKTFLVKSFLSRRSDYLYVSVNGTTKAADIVERLYLAAFPVLADKTMRTLGSIARSVGGVFRVKSDLKMEDLLDLDKYNILIFDDLERSLMQPEELLGFINNFVEHDSKHVILLANESELSRHPSYERIREKVVGFSLDVKPDFESALAVFGSSLSAPYAKFLEHAHDELMKVLQEANLKNVRVVKYVLGEFAEIFDQLTSRDIGDKESLELFLVFLVLDYAYKTGGIQREDIRKRTTDDFTRAFMRQREGYQPGSIDRLDDTHPNVDVYSTSFDNEYLESKICDGFHDSQKLSRTLGDISGKANPTENPEWRNLWYLIHQTDEVIDESFARMMLNFRERRYDDAGIIFHVFGLMYRMRDAKLLRWSTARIIRECKKYVSDKFKDRSLPLLGGDFITDLRHGSAHGLGFTSIREPGFQEAVNFYREKSDKLKSILLLKELNSITAADEFDLARFRSIILQGARDDNVYARAFLHQTSARDFAESVMKEPADRQFEVLAALGSRYEQSPYRDVSLTEAPWLRDLIKALRSIIAKQPVTTRFRINEIIRWNLETPAKADQNKGAEIDSSGSIPDEHAS